MMMVHSQIITSADLSSMAHMQTFSAVDQESNGTARDEDKNTISISSPLDGATQSLQSVSKFPSQEASALAVASSFMLTQCPVSDRHGRQTRKEESLRQLDKEENSRQKPMGKQYCKYQQNKEGERPRCQRPLDPRHHHHRHQHQEQQQQQVKRKQKVEQQLQLPYSHQHQNCEREEVTMHELAEELREKCEKERLPEDRLMAIRVSLRRVEEILIVKSKNGENLLYES
ncbi:unnamed protein product [Protopolystoma xenopodis]|uniref:Uncharacterized protein n=1 Tax=Protopolystoma xenopodis TaxID=117903 RepID=A0A448WPE8_9PLAT|nr:unnamed protein product [Protopolystoma xenopodis]